MEKKKRIVEFWGKFEKAALCTARCVDTFLESMRCKRELLQVGKKEYGKR